MYTDKFQFQIESHLEDFFSRLRYSAKETESYVYSKYEKHLILYKDIPFPIIEIDIIYRENRHNLLFLDKYNMMKVSSIKRDRTRHILSSLEDCLKWKNLTDILPKNSFKIYFDVSDTYYEDSEGYPIFVHARPKNVDIPLFPDHTYFKMNFDTSFIGNFDKKFFNWDEAKEIFKQCREIKSPVKKSIFFRGVDSTSNPSCGDNSNIRNVLANLSDKDILSKDHRVIIKVFPVSEIKKKTIPLYEDCGYETYLDLPGNFPWSYRKKFLYLTGGDVIQVYSYNEKSSKYNWIQFIDLILNDFDTITIDFNYISDKDNTERIKDLYNRFKHISRLNPNQIEKRLKFIEMLNMDRLYQYMAKMLLHSAKASSRI